MDREKRRSAFAWFLLLTVMLALAVVWSPPDDGVSVCFSKSVLGVSCPGCGLTRSVSAMAKGDLETSLRFHALGPLFLLIMAGAWAVYGWCLLFRKPLPPSRHLVIPVSGLIVMLVGYWIYRGCTGGLP